jgi:hypothetical protein
MSKQAKLPKEAEIKSKPGGDVSILWDYIFGKPKNTDVPKKTK